MPPDILDPVPLTEAVAEHNNWTDWEKGTHLMAILQKAVDALHNILTKVGINLFLRSKAVLRTTNWLQCTVHS
jgi:hypothetical protein